MCVIKIQTVLVSLSFAEIWLHKHNELSNFPYQQIWIPGEFNTHKNTDISSKSYVLGIAPTPHTFKLLPASLFLLAICHVQDWQK